MAIQIESFLVLEKSLSSRLYNSWRRTAAGPTRQIVEAVQRGNFVEAVELCDELTMAPSAERNRQFAEFVGMQAALFGASQLTGGNARRTNFMSRQKPDQVKQAAEVLVGVLSKNGTEQLCRQAQTRISQEQVDQQEETVKSERRKGATDGFVGGFVSFVDQNGNAFIDIGSSLHTSRLSAWGFTVEAELRGITKYQINEQLDGRTCPVCRNMHGREFEVEHARRKLEMWLEQTDPDQLKSIAPWPAQNQAAVTELQQMTPSELQQKGWDTPPFHPLCRGVLVEQGTVRTLEPIDPVILPPAQPSPRSARPVPAAIGATLAGLFPDGDGDG